MNEIFISYRKTDDPFAAALIDRKLCERFGADRIFRDGRAIAADTGFQPRLWGTAARSAALVVVIGPRWLEAGPDGRRYIDSPDDFIRQKITFALRTDVQIIPVLVGDARQPTAAHLPDDLRPLADLQHLRLNTRNVEYDLIRLADALATILRCRASTEHDATVVSIATPAQWRTAVEQVLRLAVDDVGFGADLAIRAHAEGPVVLAPPQVQPIMLLTDLLAAFRSRLTEVPEHPTDTSIRLRVGIHSGSVSDRDGTLSGEAITITDRLLAIHEVAHTFAGDPAVHMVVVVSDAFYREVVLPADAVLDASTFRRARIPESPEQAAWIHVPGSGASLRPPTNLPHVTWAAAAPIPSAPPSTSRPTPLNASPTPDGIRTTTAGSSVRHRNRGPDIGSARQVQPSHLPLR